MAIRSRKTGVTTAEPSEWLECPRCECRHAINGRCRHCGTRMKRTTKESEMIDVDSGGSDDAGVTFHVIRCPSCRSDDTRVTSTRRPVRHHKCGKCGHNFKSVER